MSTKTVTGWAALDALKDGKTLADSMFADKFKWDFGLGALLEDSGDGFVESETPLAFFFGMEFEVEE